MTQSGTMEKAHTRFDSFEYRYDSWCSFKFAHKHVETLVCIVANKLIVSSLRVHWTDLW